MQKEIIRPPVAAGSFYPSDPNSLKKEVKGYLDNAKNLGLENIKALIAPHAGYIYSGQVAAWAYKQVEGSSFESALVIAPSHSEYFGFASIYPGQGYQTPLGIAQIDQEAAQMLAGHCDYIKFSSQGHNREHSLEVQIPFLQVVLDGIDIIPMVIGGQVPEIVDAVGTAIGEAFAGKNILIVASSDLSHYHPYDAAVNLDGRAQELVADFNIKGLSSNFYSQDLEMCGGGPVIAAMTAAKAAGAQNSKVLSYKNSGDVIGDKSAVVGYLSAALY